MSRGCLVILGIVANVADETGLRSGRENRTRDRRENHLSALFFKKRSKFSALNDETYAWSWAEVNGRTGECTIGNLQHTEKEQQRAKEAEETLRIAIKEEQADIQNKNTKEEEAIEERQGKKRAELGIRMLQELERHIEGKKRSKGNKNIAEIRRGTNRGTNERSAGF